MERTEPPFREVWKQVPGLEFISVSNRGRVKRLKRLKGGFKEIFLTVFERYRSIVIQIKINKKIHRYSVATLLAKAFYDEDADSSNLKFLDGDKSNITTTNTEYVSSSTGKSLRRISSLHNITKVPNKAVDTYVIRFSRGGKKYRSCYIYDLDQAKQVRDDWIAEIDEKEAKKDKAQKVLNRKYGV